MADNYWIRNRGRSYGPYSTEKIQQLVARGQLSTACQISEDGVTWGRSDDYPELFAGKAQTEAIVGAEEPVQAEESEYQLTEPMQNTGGSVNTAVTWRYIVDGNPSDPVSQGQLRQLIASGVVLVDGLVWNETLPNWVKAKDVPGLVPESLIRRPVMTDQPQTTSLKGPAPLSQFAIVSFVCGAGGLMAAPLCGVLALIFGYICLYSRHIRNGSLRGKGLAIAGISMGWCCVVIVVLIVVLALAYPENFAKFSAAQNLGLF